MSRTEVKRALLLGGLMASHVDTRYTLTLAKALSQREVTVHVLCERGSRVEAFREARIPVSLERFVTHPLLYRFGRKPFLQIVESVQPQVLHAQDLDLVRLGERLAGETGLPLVATARRSPHRHEVRWLSDAAARRFIAVNEAVREDLVNVARVPKDRIMVVPEGIDVSEYLIGPEPNPNVAPTVGIVAPFERPYGHDHFLAAAKLVHAAAPEVQFLIAGDGELEDELRRQVRALNLEKNVVFATNIGDYRPFLRIVDILVMPAVQDLITFSLMEAMALGKAVIASSVGGTYVLVRNEETGYLVGRGDAAEIARRVLELVKDRQKAQRIGRNARQFVEQNFGLASLALRTIRVYEESLEETH